MAYIIYDTDRCSIKDGGGGGSTKFSGEFFRGGHSYIWQRFSQIPPS